MDRQKFKEETKVYSCDNYDCEAVVPTRFDRHGDRCEYCSWELREQCSYTEFLDQQ